MQFSFKAAFALGWQTFLSRYRALLGASAVVALLSFAVSAAADLARLAFVGERPGIAMEPDNFTITFLLLNASLELLLGVFFTLPLFAGLLLLALKHVRGESPPLGVAFAGFSERYAPLVGIGALAAAPVLLAAVLFMDVGPSPLFLLLIPVGLALVIRLSLSWMLCIDPRRRLDVVESYAVSWRLTGPVFWPLLAVSLAALLISALSAALFFLPLIFFGLPLSYAVLAAAYELITGGAASGAAPAAETAP